MSFNQLISKLLMYSLMDACFLLQPHVWMCFWMIIKSSCMCSKHVSVFIGKEKPRLAIILSLKMTQNPAFSDHTQQRYLAED